MIIGSAYFFLIKARFLFWLAPTRTVEDALKKGAGSGQSFHPLHPLQRLSSLFQIAWRYQWKRPGCLPTSLARQFFYLHYGYKSEFRIGVKKEDSVLEAHAWCKIVESEKPVWADEGSFQSLERIAE